MLKYSEKINVCSVNLNLLVIKIVGKEIKLANKTKTATEQKYLVATYKLTIAELFV
jgi:hypothetical protein